MTIDGHVPTVRVTAAENIRESTDRSSRATYRVTVAEQRERGGDAVGRAHAAVDAASPASTLALARSLVLDSRDAEAMPLLQGLLDSECATDPAARPLVLALAAHVRTVEGDVDGGRRLA